MDYSKHVSDKKTSQQDEVLGKNQVQNNAGGFVFEITPISLLERFLILGTEGGTYYSSEKKLTIGNADNILQCIINDGDDQSLTASTIISMWNDNRAPKVDPIMFALALTFAKGGQANRDFVETHFNATARTGFHLFRFVHYVTQFRGWGRSLKRLIANWYTSKPIDRLAYQLAKYQQREGWSHKDLLRLSHAMPLTKEQDVLFKTVVGKAEVSEFPQPFAAMHDVAHEVITVQEGISQFNLTQEMIPGQFKGDVKTWESLFPGMPMTALIRNLGNLSNKEVIGEGKWANNKLVVDKLTNEDILHKARIHPIQVLSALSVYNEGRGQKGSLTWNPVSEISTALDSAFYKAFKNVQPTNKRFVLGLDVSGSMGWGMVAGVPGLTPAQGAAVMTMLTLKKEPFCLPLAFTHNISKLKLNASMNLDQVMHETNKHNFGGTDCAAPITYALENNIEADVFVVYTDNETWSGSIHPFQALQMYRKQMGINAKLIVVGFAGNKFSIADPSDPGMLDMVGFDSAAPQIMREFILS